jgi:DNA-binding transcriptional LysR family regulator
MDTQFLESFVMVVEHGSVAEAARHLNLTSAAVSQRIHALEREIGVTLVSRSGRTVRATEAGAAVLAQAQTLLRGVRDLRATAHDQNYAGELSLGAVSSALTGLLPPLLSKLAKDYPLMTLRIYPGTSSELYRKVADGEVDAAVIVEPNFMLPKTCEWVTWREEPLVVLAHRKITDRDPHRILSCEPFIRYDRKQWGGRLADDYLHQFDIHPHGHYELDSLDAIAVLVDRELGVSLVPDWAPPWPEGLTLTKIPLPLSKQKRRLGVVWRRSSPNLRLVQALVAEVRKNEPQAATAENSEALPVEEA